MKDLENKIKAWYGKMFAKTPSYDRRFLRPSRDWGIIFTVTLLSIFICAFGAFYFYQQVDSGNFFGTPSEIPQSELKINTTLLKQTVDDINARETTFANAQRGNVAPPDPSR